MNTKATKSKKIQLDTAINNSSFSDTVDVFIEHIESLKVTFPLFTKTVLSTHKTTLDNLEQLKEAIKTENKEIYEDNATLEQVKHCVKPQEKNKVTSEQFKEYEELQKENKSFEIASSILRKSFIVSLISQFDIHISRLIRTMFYVKPETLNSSEKIFKFSELIEFETIEAAKEHLIEKEIETVLRESHSKQFEWLEKKLELRTLKDLQAWSTFIEITERRNLFVHCDGIISSQYINVCKNNKVIIGNENKLGSKLDVDEKYFEDAYKCIFELGVKLAQTMWRKLKPNDLNKANTNLHNICIDLISKEEYGLAHTILDFANTDIIKRSFSEKFKLLFLINKAQTLKWSGEDKKASEILGSIDYSACRDEFKMVKAVLLNDFDEAAKLMLRVGKHTEIFPKENYKTSPAFREFRESTLFLETYEKIFDEPFSIEEASSIIMNKAVS
jgi:hypothetical protein